MKTYAVELNLTEEEINVVVNSLDAVLDSRPAAEQKILERVSNTLDAHIEFDAENL